MLLTPSTPRVIPGRTIDILDLAPSRGMSRGFIRVDFKTLCSSTIRSITCPECCWWWLVLNWLSTQRCCGRTM